MKTLVFCAGSHSPNLKYLSELIELNGKNLQSQNLILIGVDGGSQYLVENGFKPDWVIGDFDTVSPPECPNVVRFSPEKDETDLEASLNFMLNRFQVHDISQIVILGALGQGRLDHLLNNIWLANQPRFSKWLNKIYCVENENSVRFLQSGSHFIKRELDKKYLSFIGLGEVRDLVLKNVKYPVHGNNHYANPTALISNEFVGSEWAYCSFVGGVVCAIQSRD